MADEAQTTAAETTAAQTTMLEAAPEATKAEAAKTEAAKAEAGKTEQGKPETKRDASGKFASADWRDGLEGEQLEFAKRLASPLDAVKSAYELRKANSSLIKPLSDKSTPEEIAAFNKRIGAGDKPEDYKFPAPAEGEPTEAAKKVETKVAAVLHKHHVPLAAAADLHAVVNEVGAELEAERNRVAVEGRQATEAALRKEWGADFEGNVQLAARAAQAFGLSETLRNTLVNGVKLGDHPEFIKTFGQIGRRMGEGQFIGAVDSVQRSSLQQAIEEKTKAMHAAHAKGDRAEAKRLDDERYQLNSQLHGNTPVVGQAGRTV